VVEADVEGEEFVVAGVPERLRFGEEQPVLFVVVVAGEPFDLRGAGEQVLGAEGTSGVGSPVAGGNPERDKLGVDIVAQEPGFGVLVDVDLRIETGFGVRGEGGGDGDCASVWGRGGGF
jgi:hypothetical protein